MWRSGTFNDLCVSSWNLEWRGSSSLGIVQCRVVTFDHQGSFLLTTFGLSAQEAEEETHAEESKSEHSKSESSENGEESEEESATQYTKTQTYVETRNGARLLPKYDTKAQEFTGTVENTTDEILKQVRVEVHLSNGTELGPTKPSDLEPQKLMEETQSVEGEEFTTWGAHPEVGESGSGERSVKPC